MANSQQEAKMFDIPQVALPNGMIVNRGIVNNVYGKLLAIQSYKQFILTEFVYLCRHPGYQVLEETKKILICNDLLFPDGQPKADVQNATLYMVFGNDQNPDLLPFDQVLQKLTPVSDSKDVE